MQEEWDWVCESEKERQGLDYYSLTREEATVFGIQPHLTKQLSRAYERFEAAIDLISMDDDQRRQREADRAVWPKWKEHASSKALVVLPLPPLELANAMTGIVFLTFFLCLLDSYDLHLTCKLESTIG